MEKMGSMPALSIIIVNWNTKSLLEDCIDSIKALWGAVADEIIVVDNASSDGSAKMVEDKFPEIILIKNKENVGFVKANNQGSEIAKGKYLLLLNSDTKVLDSDVDKILEYMDKHPGVGAVTGKVLNEDGSFQRPFRRLPHPLGAFFRHTLRLILGFNTPFHKHFLMANYSSEQEYDVQCITGAYFYVRREFCIDNAIFDKGLSMYYEDTLLSHHIINLGAKIKYLPFAKIIHYGGSSARQVRAWSVFKSFQGSVLYFRKTQSHVIASTYQLSVYLLWNILKSLFQICSLVPVAIFTRKKELFSQLLQIYHSEMELK